MKKISLAILTILLVIMPNVTSMELHASSGKLKSGSICSSGGYTYGNHSDGHWHYAEQRSNGWYPQGESLGYENPCVAFVTPMEEPLVIEESQSYEVAVSPEIYEENIETDTAHKQEEQQNYNQEYVEAVKNTAPIITLGKESYELYNTKMGSLDTKTMISIFDARASDGEDGDLTDKITVDPEVINLYSITNNEKVVLRFNVVDSSGLEDNVEGNLSVIANAAPVITYNKDFKVSRNPKCPSVIEQLGLYVEDKEDGKIDISCDMLTINQNMGTIRIEVVDSGNAVTSETIQYKKSSNRSDDKSWLGLLIVAIIITSSVAYSKNKKKKN